MKKFRPEGWSKQSRISENKGEKKESRNEEEKREMKEEQKSPIHKESFNINNFPCMTTSSIRSLDKKRGKNSSRTLNEPW